MRFKTIKSLVEAVSESDINFLEISSFFYRIQIKGSFTKKNDLYKDSYGDHSAISMYHEFEEKRADASKSLKTG